MTEGLDTDQREDFMEELYARQGADQAAKQLLREHMQAAGLEWDEEI